MSPRRRTTLTLALVACVCAPASAGARADTQVGLHASFLPRRLGAATAMTLALRLAGGEEGVPPPLRTLALHLPAGLSVQLSGAGSCTVGRLRSRGPSGCPASALLGRGQARLEVHAGSQTIPEQAALWAFRASRTTLAIVGVGHTPLDERVASGAVLRPDRQPFGSQLVLSVPPIRTLELEPDASFDSLSLTVGGGSLRAHAAGARIRVPARCPAGGFRFAADVGFADGSGAHATAVVPCP